MKLNLLFCFWVLSLSVCAEDLRMCQIVQDLKTGKILHQVGKAQCNERFPACSTFKVPLALAAFDHGELKDENTLLKWDGKTYPIKEWEQDQLASTWMKYSVVWYSQRLTVQMGKATLEKYLKQFHYGTADMSGGIDRAWLPKNPFEGEKGRPTVLISPKEQLEFLRDFWIGKLGVSERATELTKKIIKLEGPAMGGFYGKTGSGPKTAEEGLGWFIGVLEKPSATTLIVTQLQGKPEAFSGKYGGFVARELSIEKLKQLKLWE